jgi:hypothetical protein
MKVRALTVGLAAGLVGTLTACAPAGEEVAPGESASPTTTAATVPSGTPDVDRAVPETSTGADPVDAGASAPLEVSDAVLVHKGGEDEVSVLIDGEPQDLERVRVVVHTDHVGWEESPARLGPFVSISGTVEPVDVTLAYPPGVTGDLDADGLLVVVDTVDEELDYLDPVWDDARGAFVVDVTVRPDEYPLFVLLDRDAHASLFE